MQTRPTSSHSTTHTFSVPLSIPRPNNNELRYARAASLILSPSDPFSQTTSPASQPTRPAKGSHSLRCRPTHLPPTRRTSQPLNSPSYLVKTTQQATPHNLLSEIARLGMSNSPAAAVAVLHSIPAWPDSHIPAWMQTPWDALARGFR